MVACRRRSAIVFLANHSASLRQVYEWASATVQNKLAMDWLPIKKGGGGVGG